MNIKLKSKILLLAATSLIAGLCLHSCSSPLQLTKGQKETISPQAQQFLEKTKLVKLPLIGFSEAITSRLNEKLTKDTALLQYKAQFAVSTSNDTIGGIPVVTVTPAKILNENVVGYYVHGGGFIFGNIADYLAMSLASRLGIPIICVDYQFSPKVKYPVAVNECYGAYQALTVRYPQKKLLVIGASAGGNLAMTTILKARDNGAPLPVAAVLYTPWTDLTGAGDSYVSNTGRDVLAWKGSLEKMMKAYTDKGTNLKDPLVSPIYADYSKGFPPTIITTGTRDIFLSNCVRLNRILKDNNITSYLTVYEGMWHGFNGMPDMPEADKCNDEVDLFLKDYIK